MTVILITTPWIICAADIHDMPAYQTCDLCHEPACDDICATTDFVPEHEYRSFFRVHGGADDGLTVCERCLEEYAKEKP